MSQDFPSFRGKVFKVKARKGTDKIITNQRFFVYGYDGQYVIFDNETREVSELVGNLNLKSDIIDTEQPNLELLVTHKNQNLAFWSKTFEKMVLANENLKLTFK